MKPHFTHFSACLLALIACGRPSLRAENTPAPQGSQQTPKIEHEGQSFELVQHQETDGLETDEYLRAGETLADWTQLVTVQRVRKKDNIPTAMEFIMTSFEKEFSAEVLCLEQTTRHALLQVSVPEQKATKAHRLLCLVSNRLSAEPALVVIQFALRQNSAESTGLEPVFVSWRQRLSTLARQDTPQPATPAGKTP